MASSKQPTSALDQLPLLFQEMVSAGLYVAGDQPEERRYDLNVIRPAEEAGWTVEFHPIGRWMRYAGFRRGNVVVVRRADYGQGGAWQRSVVWEGLEGAPVNFPFTQNGLLEALGLVPPSTV